MNECEKGLETLSPGPWRLWSPLHPQLASVVVRAGSPLTGLPCWPQMDKVALHPLPGLGSGMLTSVNLHVYPSNDYYRVEANAGLESPGQTQKKL